MGPSIADPSRRSAIVGALAAGAAGLANAQAFDFKPNQRYPGPAVQVLDPSFAEYRLFTDRGACWPANTCRSG